MTQGRTERRLREMFLALAGMIAVGSVTELLLLLHFEKVLQWVPFILCAMALGVVLVVWRRPSRRSIRALWVVMALVLVGSIWGVALHLKGNLEFVEETKPKATPTEIAWGMMHGASPVLAPGMLVIMALAGMAATYQHPALRDALESDRA